MLVSCNTCKKKFEVPASAIKSTGRLLQCGSCGNKWTQYPIKEESVQEAKTTAPVRLKNLEKSKKNLRTKKKRKVNLYSEEYLQKKHGLSIKKSFVQLEKNKKVKNNFSFYSYLITISVFLFAILGILNLSKNIIILNYPSAELYFNYFYEVINIIKIIFIDILN